MVERVRQLLAAFQFEVFKFSSFHLYQKCPFKTFYGLYNILKVSKTLKLQRQTRPKFTAIALRLNCVVTFVGGGEVWADGLAAVFDEEMQVLDLLFFFINLQPLKK